MNAGRQPNIILINCDDLGYGDLGCYGSDRNDTPAIDRFASEGARFTNFYMASPVCSPSRAALLTGCYPPRVGFGSLDGLPVLFPGQRVGLHPDEVTIANILQGAGYATKHVGKWHVGDQPPFLPTRHGFDSSYGIPYSHDMGRQRGNNILQLLRDSGVVVADDNPPLPLLLDDEVIEEQPDLATLTGRFVEESLRFIRTNRSRPFFLYFAHIYVHLPLYVQERFERDSRNGPYGAAVACIDWATDVLLNEIDRLGLDDNTVIIFTSDNGARGDHGGSNGPLRGNKGTTWEGGMRVPFIVRWPGRVPAATVRTELASAIDLLPTLASIAGASAPTDREIDGLDLTQLILDGEPSPREELFYYNGDNLEAIRDGRWKLHTARQGNEVSELYDLQADPEERDNLFDQHPDVVKRLRARAAAAVLDLGDARTNTPGNNVRRVGEVEEAAALTTFDPAHPYYMAEYDLADMG